MKYTCLALLTISIFISGCSLFSPVKSKPVNTYVISTIPESVRIKSHTSTTLFVNKMDTDPMYATPKMMYTIRPYEVNYFADNQWIENPAQMLQSLIAQTLRKTHHYRAVSTSAMGRYDYALNTQLIKLQQKFMKRSSVVELIINVQIVNLKTNQIVASREFSACEFTTQFSPRGGVYAANRAAGKILKEIADYVIRVT